MVSREANLKEIPAPEALGTQRYWVYGIGGIGFIRESRIDEGNNIFDW